MIHASKHCANLKDEALDDLLPEAVIALA